ncbi:UNVERIFIED_CONTAM: hypothetical protein FKN15_057114 [Acipenser sinensis]
MKRSPDVSPRRLSDISPQLRQLKYLDADESIKEDLKSSRSVEDINSASIGLTSIEERILRITGYYGYQPWTAIYNMLTCDRDRMSLSVRSPSRPVRARYTRNRVPLMKWHDNLFRRVDGSRSVRKGAEPWHPSSVTQTWSKVKTKTHCPPKNVPSATRFFTHCRLTMQQPRATALEDNAALGSLQASPQLPGQTTGVAGGRKIWQQGPFTRQTKEKIAQNRSVATCTGGEASGQEELTSLEKNIENIFTPEQQGVQGVTDTTRHKGDSQPGDERPRENLTPAEAQVPAAPDTEGQSVTRCCLKLTASQARKICWGVAVLLGVCLSWTGSTQLAKLAFRKFDAPFTLTWFATNWNFLFFPLYYIGHLYTSTVKQSPRQRYSMIALKWLNAFEALTIHIKIVAAILAIAGIVMMTYADGFHSHSVIGIALVVGSASMSALYKIVAAILAIAGIVMMTYADGFHSHSVIGIALVVGSASMSALYKVLFKLILGSAKFGEAALFLTILGGVNFVFFSFVPVILYFTKVEYFDSIDAVPWGYLCGVSVLLLTFNILVNFGIAVTYPTLISLGIVLSVPVNAAVDHYTSEISFNTVRVIAVLTISLGFLLLLLPEEWDQWIIKLLTRLKVWKKEEAAEGNGEAGPGLSWSRRARSSMSNFTH